MKKVQRSEIVDYQTYGETRDQTRAQVMAVKGVRRIHVGPHLTFLFENRDTVRYQVQEMMRTEQIVREKDIQHELDTYNELLGDDGELGCTLLIEIDDEQERNALLRAYLPLLQHLFAETPAGDKVRPTYDPRQVGEDRLSSVQYLTFPVGPEAPVALGADLAAYAHRAALTEAQRAALQADLDDR